jgi:hypothetical protein
MTRKTYDVVDVTYHCHTESDGFSVMEVCYLTDYPGSKKLRRFSEYLNFETKGNTGEYWEKRSLDPRPVSNQHAVDIANYQGITKTKKITVEYRFGDHGNYCYKIVGYELGIMPPGIEETW